jgi:hypothetical protein
MFVAGLLMGGVTVLIWRALFRRLGVKVRRLDPDEAGRVAVFPMRDARYYTATGKGAGYGIGFRFNGQTLREIAKRGDWPLFWLYPIAFSSFGVSITLVITSTVLLVAAGQGSPHQTGDPIAPWLCILVALFGSSLFVLPWLAVRDALRPEAENDSASPTDRGP